MEEKMEKKTTVLMILDGFGLNDKAEGNAVKQAKTYGHSLEREVGFLTVHSMLHLLGYDHETSPLDAANMREKEEAILGELGISRDVTFTPDAE